MKRLYFGLANTALRVRFWFQGDTWEQTIFQLFAYRLAQAITKTDFHVFRTNREL
jgi:hypothetical protein